MADNMNDNYYEFRLAIQNELTNFTSQSNQSSAECKPVSLDQQSVGRLSRMDAFQIQEMAKALDTRCQQRCRELNAALNRIERREYGICEGCGDDIPEKRLQINPAARLCIQCFV